MQAAKRRESISVTSILVFLSGILFGSSFCILLGLVVLTLSGCAALVPNNEGQKFQITQDELCRLWERVPFDWKVDWYVSLSDLCDSPPAVDVERTEDGVSRSPE